MNMVKYQLIVILIIQLIIINGVICKLLHISPKDISLTVGANKSVHFYTNNLLTDAIEIKLKQSKYFIATPQIFELTAENRAVDVIVKSKKITANEVLEIENCSSRVIHQPCPFTNLMSVFANIKVVHSTLLTIAVVVVGWIYFLAWSISFYPQIHLNYQRKSVVGLNFDFLLLNIIGFTCYTIYNILMYFDSDIAELYEQSYPHSSIPVMMNDLVFAVHALIACLITAFQCFIYERGSQHVSKTCWALSLIFALIATFSSILSMAGVINALQFITYLSYIKMIISLCKYFPQAILNYRRKSTVGWSIGNVLLDFIGGSMDILQMILQSINTEDWSAFYGNPVKFGLGLVSMIFDIVFIIQHYVLYKSHEQEQYTVEFEKKSVSADEIINATLISIRPKGTR